MSVLPNTTTKGADRRWPLYVLVAVVLVALALGVEGMEARVERAELGSAFSLLFDRGASSIEVLDEQEDQLSTGQNGATGIMKFALATISGEPVPPGNYTVEVYGPDATGEEEAVAARKLFVIEE